MSTGGLHVPPVPGPLLEKIISQVREQADAPQPFAHK